MVQRSGRLGQLQGHHQADDEALRNRQVDSSQSKMMARYTDAQRNSSVTIHSPVGPPSRSEPAKHFKYPQALVMKLCGDLRNQIYDLTVKYANPQKPYVLYLQLDSDLGSKVFRNPSYHLESGELNFEAVSRFFSEQKSVVLTVQAMGIFLHGIGARGRAALRHLDFTLPPTINLPKDLIALLEQCVNIRDFSLDPGRAWSMLEAASSGTAAEMSWKAFEKLRQAIEGIPGVNFIWRVPPRSSARFQNLAF